jgi:hypothetical protein
VALIVTSYLMYDHIPARLYRNIFVETDGRKLRILEGEVSESQPCVHVERNRHIDCTAERLKQRGSRDAVEKF